MKVLKWLFCISTLLCYFLWSGYHSLQTGFEMATDISSKPKSPASIKLEEADDNDVFKLEKYKQMTPKSPDNLRTSTIRIDAETRRKMDNDQSGLTERTRNILKTFKTKPDSNISRNVNVNKYQVKFKDKHDAKPETGDKTDVWKLVNDFTDTESEQAEQKTKPVSRTYTTFDAGVDNKEFDHTQEPFDSVDVLIEKQDTDNLSNKADATQKEGQTSRQHALDVDTVLDSTLEKEHVDKATTLVSTLQEHVDKATTLISSESSRGFTSRRRTLKYDIPFTSGTEYAVPDLQTLRINKTQNTTFVLLVTYARSGSTWLGEITNQANGTFYVFEPFQKMVVQGYYKEDLVCYNNNTCRKPRLFSETHRYALTTLHRLFTCQLTKLSPKTFGIFIKNLKSKNYARTFRTCFLSTRSVNICKERLEDICSTTTHRILKTIRISMELVYIMMDLWPNLKIINLVRDPRGITSSRLNSNTFGMVKQLVPHSKDVCNRMSTDIQVNTALNKKYKNRLRLVFYESLAERPLEGAKFIYKFLDMKLTPEVINWVYNSTHAQAKSGYFGIMRSDAVENAYHWRTRLRLNTIKIIDKYCLYVYKILGLTTFNSTEDLISFSIPARKSSNNPNWFS